MIVSFTELNVVIDRLNSLYKPGSIFHSFGYDIYEGKIVVINCKHNYEFNNYKKDERYVDKYRMKLGYFRYYIDIDDFLGYMPHKMHSLAMKMIIKEIIMEVINERP